MDWLTDNFWLGWIGLAILLAAIEAATVDFVFLMFAGGALVAAAASGAGASFPVQMVLGVAAAILLLVVVRPIIRRQLLDEATDHRIGAAGLVGREARVLQAVTDTDGRIKLAGETWSARVADGSPTIGPGEDVTVIAIHGATAIVGPAGTVPHPPTTPQPPT
jgi:membrane protein implicated in regulation of membrane protease activity